MAIQTLLYYNKTTGDLVAQLTMDSADHAKYQQENPNLGYLEATVNRLRDWYVNLSTLQLEQHISQQPLI